MNRIMLHQHPKRVPWQANILSSKAQKVLLICHFVISERPRIGFDTAQVAQSVRP